MLEIHFRQNKSLLNAAEIFSQHKQDNTFK